MYLTVNDFIELCVESSMLEIIIYSISDENLDYYSEYYDSLEEYIDFTTAPVTEVKEPKIVLVDC